MKIIDKAALVTVLAVAAGLLGGCGRQDVRVCADASGWRLPDDDCTRYSTGGGGSGGWLYINGGGAPAVGERVQGGSTFPKAGARYGAAPEGGIGRGGFGGSGEGFGAHGSGE